MYFKSLSDHTSMLAFSTFNVYMAQDLTLPLSLNVDICIIIKIPRIQNITVILAVFIMKKYYNEMPGGKSE